MNDINRAAVKQQARELIKGKFFQIFILIFIAGLLTGSSSGLNLRYNINDNDFNLFGGNGYSDDYGYDENDLEQYYKDNFGDYDFDTFYENQQDREEDNPIDGFGEQIPGAVSKLSSDASVQTASLSRLPFLGILGIAGVFSVLISLIFVPLDVTLSGILVRFIRRNPAESFDLGRELGALFKDTFNKNFFKKLGLVLLRGLFIFLLSLLFIIPGIMYAYSTYFAYQLMCDNPDLSPSEALALSKKMTQGHRMELFVLNLSFIPWLLLCLVTFGLASIYVMPYMQVTDALFYENFRIRALQFGVVSEHEVTSREAMNNQADNNYFTGNPYANPNADPYSNNYYNGQGGNYYSAQQGNYYTPQQNGSDNYQQYNYGASQQGSGSGQGSPYTPPQDYSGTQSGEYYQPPTDSNYNKEN